MQVRDGEFGEAKGWCRRIFLVCLVCYVFLICMLISHGDFGDQEHVTVEIVIKMLID